MTVKKIIPSALTSLNLLCGFWAILINDAELSFYLVLIAIGFDFMDGLSARALKVQSVFGKELDSLADMVTFGVVPGFLYFHHVLEPLDSDLNPALLSMLLATMVPVCAGLRLAKFNVKDSGKKEFSGLPSSAAALFVISVPFVGTAWTSFIGVWPLFLIPVIASLLMVSNIRMFSLKNLGGGISANLFPLIYAVTLIPLAFLLRLYVIPASVLWYLILSVPYAMFTKPS